MDFQEIERKKEEKHLSEIITIAKSELTRTDKRIAKERADIIEGKQEQRDFTPHHVGNLYNAESFEDLIAINQYAEQISLQINDLEMDMKTKERLQKVIQSPYFARIDFTFSGDNEKEQIYIGRFHLSDEQAHRIHVYDWRSPIASVFYRYGLGKAAFEAPVGTISGKVSLKRQYEIKNSQLAYFFDCEVEIMDEFLKQLLAQNTSGSMHAIVETIQRDQDVIIRDMTSDLMMVQGVAGSGKTSVALHRIAYLMYQGMSGRLMADNILIISPNSLFEQYISRVLPELGEENVVSYLFEEIMEKILGRQNFQSYRQFQELLSVGGNESIGLQSFQAKTSHHFAKLLREYAAKKPTVKDSKALYQQLLEEVSWDKDILIYTRENMSTRKMYYEDALCICYLKLLQMGGWEESGRIKQVVIDEVQDYTPLHFEILKLLYPRAAYTVLGDTNQAIGRRVEADFYTQVERILDRPKSVLVQMNKSFRCTQQILEFSVKYLESPISIESFCRDGDEPESHEVSTPHELDQVLIEELRFSLGKGYQSIALICENQKAARILHRRLSKKWQEQGWEKQEREKQEREKQKKDKREKEKQEKQIEISLVSDEDTRIPSQISVLPLYMAKGLEFDSVLVVNIHLRQHLYIAATRALHRLNVYKVECPRRLTD